MIQLAIIICILGGWELSIYLGIADPFFFSSPSLIIANVYEWLKTGLLLKNLFVTLLEAATGLLIGMMLGVAIGYLFAANKKIDSVLQPFITVINALPRIAFAPLIILWFGLGFLSKVVIVVSLVFFVVFFNSYQGIKDINPIYLKNAKLLGAKRIDIIKHIYVPATLTWIFASLRLSVGYSIIAAVLGEYIGSGSGIGYLIDNAQSMFDATGVMTGLLVLTLTVAMIDYSVRKIELHFAKWRI